MQLTDQEKRELRAAKDAGKNVSEELKDKLESFLTDSAHASGDTICCKIWSNGWQYYKATRQSCKDVDGEVVDDSKCT